MPSKNSIFLVLVLLLTSIFNSACSGGFGGTTDLSSTAQSDSNSDADPGTDSGSSSNGNSCNLTSAGSTSTIPLVGAGTTNTSLVADFRNIPSLDLYPNKKETVNGITLVLTTGGDLQLLDSSSKILWHSNTSASCGTTACHLVMQGDGNVVLYGPNGALWDAATYSTSSHGAGAILTVESHPANLVIRDGLYNVVWKALSTTPSADLASTTLSATKATSVKSFIKSIGVNSHMDQNGTSYAQMKKMLDYLGVINIRDGYHSDMIQEYKNLAADGYTLDLVMSDPYSGIALQEQIAGFGSGFLLALEGPNEINNFQFTVNGQKSTTGWPNDNGSLAQMFMTKMYSLVNASSALNKVATYNLTWGGTNNPDQYGMLDLTSQADYGNIHLYPGNGAQPRGYLLSGLGGYHSVLPNRAVITEVGYSTSLDTDVVSEKAQVILTLNLLLDAYSLGYQLTYLYELYDEWQGYGLFYTTAGNPKPAATALHNLTTILADSGSGATSPGTLNYSFTGLPAAAYSMLLQKSSCAFDIVVWNEAKVYANGADVTVPSTSVTVSLDGLKSRVRVYDPIQGTTTISDQQNVSSVTIALSSHPLVIEVVP